MKTEKQWKEIFSKIINETDLIFEVLDARNPNGTRIYMLEDFVKKNTNKKLYLILNKIDLIPGNVLQQWIQYFKKDTKYDLFYVSASTNRGLIYFRKQLNRLFLNETKAIIVGYPNTGKSSLISALTKGKKKVGISSTAGFTRGVIAYRITPKILLFDTPGVIPLSEEDECELALKDAINPEKVKNKELVIYKIITLYVSPNKILENFDINEEFIKTHLERGIAEKFIEHFLSKSSENIGTVNAIKFRSELSDNNEYSPYLSLEQDDFEIIIKLIGLKRGLIIKGGIVNEDQVYNTIIHAWQKNKIKYYFLPPIEKKESNPLS